MCGAWCGEFRGLGRDRKRRDSSRKRKRERHSVWCMDTKPFMFMRPSSLLAVTSHLTQTFWPG